MATRAAAFSSKVRTLNDFYNNVTSGVPPSGFDIANAVKYFSQALLGVLKEMTIEPNQDQYSGKHSYRVSKYPSLNYSSLYHSLINLIEIVPSIQLGQTLLAQCILHALACLAPFLPYDLLDALPYTFASTLSTFPQDVHKEILDTLCQTLLSINMAYTEYPEHSMTTTSIASIIFIVLENIENPTYHAQLMECLLSLKADLIYDILFVIAHGAASARSAAANLLFFYWPMLNPLGVDRQSSHFSFNARKPIICQTERCMEKKNIASKVCVNAILSMHGHDSPPPLYMCTDCYKSSPKEIQQYCRNILLPVAEIDLHCQNKSCISDNKSAYAVCYSIECCQTNFNQAISLCRQCHERRHIDSNHVYQETILDIWRLPPDAQNHLVEAIISLLKEADNPEERRIYDTINEDRKSLLVETIEQITSLNTVQNPIVYSTFDVDASRKRLSRYGVYLLVGLIEPTSYGPPEIFGRLLSMLFQWFDSSVYLPDDEIGNTLGKLKTQHIIPWSKAVVKEHYELVVSILLPHPMDFAKVGGVWETMANRPTQIKECLNKLFNLIPADIITYEIWDYIMPYWMEAIRLEVSETDIMDLQLLLRKMFDPEMSPSSLTREQLYNFITDRFQSPAPASVQEQALQWLQILCQLEIFIPVQLLMQIFITGVNSLQKLESRAQRREVYTSSSNEQSLRNSFEQGLNTVQGNETTQTIGQTSSLPSSAKQFLVFDTYETYRAHRHQLMLQQMTGQEMVSIIKEEEEEFIINESELNSKCSIMMIDMLLKQMELQLTPQHQGMYNPLSKEILLLLNKQLILPWTRRHHCRNLSSQCAFCEEYILWFSIANDLLKHISPRDEIKLPELEVPNVNELKQQQQQQQQQQMTKPKFNIDSAGDGPGTTVSISSSNEDEQTNGQQDPDTPAIVSSPPIQQQQVQTSLAPELKVENNPDGGVWITSHGVFYFKLNTLHIHLQFFYSALKELDRVIDIDALYYLLCCLRLLILNDECLETSAKDNRGFLIYCLERLLIPHIWKILSLGYGHLNECCVPLLLHALSYEAGKSALWAILDRDYTSTHWKVRSSAVTRVISLTQLLKPKFVKNNYNVLSVLAYSFMNLMASIEDIEPTVSQKAMCSLETLSDCAMRTVMCSLEFQFDTVISDRSLILHRLSKLYSILLQQNKQQSTTKGVLNWEFFLNRFDTLSLESQISLEESGDIVSPQSIGGFNTESEHFIRKLNQIKFAMARTDSIRPITSSIKLQQNKSIRIPAPSTTQQTRETQSSIPRRLSNLASASIHTHLTEHSETDSIASLLPDVESSDKSTLQLLVTLLMKFMTKDDQNQVGEDRIMFKHQNVVIRHLCSLLGYNQTNRTFTYSPSRLRKSPVFHAVLSDLPKVVDYNYSLCTILLPIFLSVLQYSTCSNATAHYFENVTQTNTLGRIDPSLRDSWLMVLIIILYKYQFTSFATTIQQLTRVAMNTILSRYHQCETPIFGIGGPTGGRLTPKVGGSRRGSSKPFDDIREIETNEVGSKYFQNGAGGEYDDGQSDVTVTDRQHKHIKLLSPPKKMKTKLYKPEIEYLDEPFSIHTEEALGPVSHKKEKDRRDGYTGFLKSFFASSASGTPASGAASTVPISSSLATTTENKLIEGSGISKLDSRKGAKELSRVIYSAEKGRHETVLLKPKEDSPPKSPKIQSLSSSALATMGTSTTKLKPSYHKKGKFKDDVRSTPPSRPARISSSQFHLKTGGTLHSLSSGRKTDVDIDGDENNLNSQVYLTPQKCDKCGTIIENYSEECIGYCIIVCSTLIHREPAIGAPLLMDMIETIGRVAAANIYTWQVNSSYVVPANARSIAQQFIRCTFHQLAGNNICYQFFQQNFKDEKLLHTIALSLNDFIDFSSIIALKWLLNDMNKQKTLNVDICTTLLKNIAIFMEYIPTDSPVQLWTSVFVEFDLLFDKLIKVYVKVPSGVGHDLTSCIKIMMIILKIPVIANVKLVIDPFSKLLTFILQNSAFQLEHIIELCSLSNRAFTKDREKLLLPRCIVSVLVEAMLHRYTCPDRNLLLMIQLILLDAGGTIYASAIVADDVRAYDPHNVVTTNGAECMKHYLNETVAFIADIHTITKVKSTMKEKSEKQQLSNLTEDTLGGQLKAGLAQYLALEFTKGGQRDTKAIIRFLPWLYNPPPSVQQGAKEFIDCIDRIRFLSWLMIGSLTHAAITRNEGTIICHPIPVDASQAIADYILYILTGFADQSKTSVIHMSSLFHSFILCQLWTMYCEQVNRGHDPEALVAIMDFWARITPGILHLLSHSKVLAEMVNLHFLSLIEALQEINSIVLANLFALWIPVLYTHQAQLPAHVQVRLQTCLNHQPSSETQGDTRFMYAILLKWLNRLQFKIGQIETQSSHAAQFYSL